MGFASAMAWLLFAISMVVTLINIGVSRRFVYYQGVAAMSDGRRRRAAGHRARPAPLPTRPAGAALVQARAETRLDLEGVASCCC